MNRNLSEDERQNTPFEIWTKQTREVFFFRKLEIFIECHDENKTVQWFGKKTHAPIENSIRELPESTRQVYAKPTTFSDISIRRKNVWSSPFADKGGKGRQMFRISKSIFCRLGILLSV